MTTTLERPPVQQDLSVPASGVLDVTGKGHGLLRTHGAPASRPSPGDVQVTADQIRRFGLRTGDFIEGTSTRPGAPARVDRVNGRPPEALRGRRHFRDLTPLHPRERLRLESEGAARRAASST